MTAQKPAVTSALAALRQAERAALLGDLLAEHPELAGDAERLANHRLASAERHAVAKDLSWTLGSLELEQLNLHAGYQRGRGYVHPVEAASELLAEALQPYLDDIGRGGPGCDCPLPRRRSRQACCWACTSTATSLHRTPSWSRRQISPKKRLTRSWIPSEPPAWIRPTDSASSCPIGPTSSTAISVGRVAPGAASFWLAEAIEERRGVKAALVERLVAGCTGIGCLPCAADATPRYGDRGSPAPA